MKRLICFCAILAGLGAAGYCGETSRIELTDGSVIAAEIVSLNNGVYTISSALREEMSRVQEKMTNDPVAMQSVAGLMLDPQFKEVMKDPEIERAVKSQDIQALMSNPKFRGLMNNQKLQEIKDRVQDSSQ